MVAAETAGFPQPLVRKPGSFELHLHQSLSGCLVKNRFTWLRSILTLYTNAKMRFQSFFMLITVQPCFAQGFNSN
jgi:hypothetical protein